MASASKSAGRITKLLIANRGEIACRVMKTARRMGIETVAVYSEADRKSLHVKMADEAYCIGPAPSQQSYLNGATILSVAEKTGSQAIHPGYGFLSENTEFAQECQQRGVIFIGPPASAIHDMGIKNTSKIIMEKAGVPVIEGYHGDNQDPQYLLEKARLIGFPCMIKAIRGGGGKGMRIALREDEFMEQLESAKREAKKSFNDEAMLLEKYIVNPRHVEVQVFGDSHGNYVYLFERDCSVQRRHQKMLEEAPAPGLTEEVRRQLGEAAVRAARAVNYTGAGTVEFVMDMKTPNDPKFYFMEMNTRLQVEHPITELITNTDLVEWQIRVASGEPLPLQQDQLRWRGHAFEARIYAEDCRDAATFLPTAGPLYYMATPQPQSSDSEVVRIDSGVRQGDEISVHYDPMIAKLVVWTKGDRHTSLDALRESLKQYHVVGLPTNVNFLLRLSGHEAFRSADVHTHFIEQHKEQLFPQPDIALSSAFSKRVYSTMALYSLMEEHSSSQTPSNPFQQLSGFRVNGSLVRKVKLEIDGKSYFAHIEYQREKNQRHFQVTPVDEKGARLADPLEVFITEDKGKHASGEDAQKSVKKVYHLRIGSGEQRVITAIHIAGSTDSSSPWEHKGELHLFDSGDGSHNVVRPVVSTGLRAAIEAGGDADVAVALSGGGSGASSPAGLEGSAPMPGVIEKVLVKVGDSVKPGQAMVTLIAMKMEYTVRATRDATVKSIRIKEGASVKKMEKLIDLE